MAKDKISDALRNYGDDIAVLFSGGKDSNVVLHLALEQKPDIPVYFCSDHPHRETWEYIHRKAARYNINLKVIREEAVVVGGDTYLFYSHENPDKVINPENIGRRSRLDFPSLDPKLLYWTLVKTYPMQRLIPEKAVFTGIRSDEDFFRQFLDYEERFEDSLGREARHGARIRVHPVLDFSEFDSHRFAAERGIESNPLYSMGYRSIGDRWTTTPNMETERGGRAQDYETIVFMASIGYINSMSG